MAVSRTTAGCWPILHHQGRVEDPSQFYALGVSALKQKEMVEVKQAMLNIVLLGRVVQMNRNHLKKCRLYI